jgi:hypothetical protein
MVRFAIFVALGSVLAIGASCSKPRRPAPPPPVSLVPTRCNEEGEPRIEVANLQRRETGKPPPLWEYLLDLRVHIGNNEKRWLLVDEKFFPEHVHEVDRLEGDRPDWLTGWTHDSSPSPRADPQVDWTFSGDGLDVTARWLPRGGDQMVTNVRAITTQDEHRVPVVLMDIIVDNMNATDWVAAGGAGNRRSVREADAVDTFTTVQCVDWLELDAPDRTR